MHSSVIARGTYPGDICILAVSFCNTSSISACVCSFLLFSDSLMASHCCTLHPRVQLSPSGECWFCRSYRPASGDRQPARLFYFLSLSLSLCLCVVSQVLQEALNAWVADNHPWRQPCIAQGAPFFSVRAISQLVFLRLSPKRTRAGA